MSVFVCKKNTVIDYKMNAENIITFLFITYDKRLCIEIDTNII